MKLKLCLLLVFIITYSWSQSGSTKTFTGNGTFPVPAGVTSIQVQAWGGGGSGGGASGAPLLLGRGAAGGGGGAYASNTVLVTPGTTLNVVVASQTSGTTGAGTAGGNSTITGFESSILAAGGSGGAANNAGGTPLGGAGGTVAASAGSIKFAGANGGNGNSWNLLGLLLSSGAGGAGASSGGAGGTAVSGLLLSNAPGNAGSPPGGAGSGAINSALGAAQIGGAGAAGRVIISYSCANFSLTSTAATNVCASAGATSTVTLTGSAASLPIGNYVVTYNRSSPSATALTANLTVSTAGTGTFTATGLTTAGSSTITITKLESESCSSTITANNTATITVSPASVGGTVSGGTSICSGNTSGLLTLSGHTGSVVKWQSSISPFTTWTDIANTTTTYTSGALTATTQFRAVVKSGLCDAVNSAATTVTVNSLPTITLENSSIETCPSVFLQSLFLSYNGVTGAPTTYSIVWNSSPANSFEAITDAVLAEDFIEFSIPPGAAVGNYVGTLTVKNENGCVSSPLTFNVNIVARPTITTSGTIDQVCTSTNLQYATLTYSATTGSPMFYSIIWDDPANDFLLTDQTNSSFSFSSGGGILNTIIIPPNVAPGTYTGTLIVGLGSCIDTQPISLTILTETVGGIVDGGTSICSGNTSEELTLFGHNGSVVKWQSSVSPFTTWTDIANTTTTYTSGVLTETTQFRAVVQSGNCGTANSAATTVTVNPLPTVTLPSPTITICADGDAHYPFLAYSATGDPTTYSIVWSPSPANNFEDVTDQALPENEIQITVPENLAAGTYTGTLTVKNENGCVSQGSVFTIIIEELPSIDTFGVVGRVCTSTNPQNGLFQYSSVTGNPTSYAIDWNSAANAALLADQPSTPFAFEESGGNIDTIVIPANVPGGSYQGTLTISNGSCSFSRGITLNVSPTTVGGEVTGGTTICTGNTSGELTLTGYTGSIISWQSSVSPFTTWTDIDYTDPTYISETLTETTQFRAVIQSGECELANSSATTVTVSPSPTITLESPSIDICSQSNSLYFDLPYTGTTGSPVTYSIVWDEAGSAIFDSATDIPLPGVEITIGHIASPPPGSYVGTLTVKNEAGCVSPGLDFTVNVFAQPAVTTTGTIDSVCTSTSLQETTLAYSAAVGNPTAYNVTWALLPPGNYTPFTFSSGGGLISGIEVPANTPAGTYSGTISFFNDGNCTSDQRISLTVLPATVAGTVTGGTTIGNGSTSGLLTLSGHTGSVVKWQSAISPFTTWADIANTDITYTSGALTETTQFRAVIQGDCDVVYSAPTTVTVIDLPTIALAPSAANTCVGYGIEGRSPLSYTATTGNPITYSIVWDSSPANVLVDVTDAPLPASPITIVIPEESDAGIYTGTLTVKNAAGISSSGSTFDVRVGVSPTFTSTKIIDPVYTSTNAQYATLAYSAVRDNPTSYAVNWDSNDIADQGITSFTFNPSGGAGTIDTIVIPANVPPGTYSASLNLYGPNCYTVSRVSIIINPAVLPTITLTSSAVSRCSTNDGSPSGLPLDYTATTGNPTTYSIVWDSSPTNNFVAVADAALPANSILLAIPAGVVSGTYTGTLTVKSANGAVSSPGSVFTVTINETPLITTTGTIDSVCSSTNSQNATLSYSGVTGTPGSYSIDWGGDANAASLADQAETPFAFDPGASVINTIEIPANVPPGTYYGQMIIYNQNCAQFQFISITILPATVAGTVTGGTTIYSGSTSGLLTLSGHEGPVLAWQYSVSPFTDWTSFTNEDTTYTSGPLTETTQYRAVIQGDCDVVYSEPTTVTVLDLPTITLASAAEETCVSADRDGSTSLSYTATTGDPVTYSIVWDSSPANILLDVTDAPLPSSPITIPIPTGSEAGIYTGTLTVKNAAGISSSGSTFEVDVAIAPTFTSTQIIDPVCASANVQYATLAYSAVRDNPTRYAVEWDSNDIADQGFTPFTFNPSGGAGTIDTIVIPANVPAGTYTGFINLYGIHCYTFYPISITINPTPTAPIITSVQQPTAEDPTGSVVLSGLPSTGNMYIIRTIPATVETYSVGESIEITDLTPGEYTFTVTNTGTYCSSEASESVVIEEVPLSRELPQPSTVSGTTDLKSLKNPVTVSALNKVINVETPNQIIDKVYIFDISGNLIYEKVGVSDPKLIITDLRSSNQVLVVKVILNNGHSEIRKVIF